MKKTAATRRAEALLAGAEVEIVHLNGQLAGISNRVKDLEGQRDVLAASELAVTDRLNVANYKLKRARRILEAAAEQLDTLDKPKAAASIRADLAELG